MVTASTPLPFETQIASALLNLERLAERSRFLANELPPRGARLAVAYWRSSETRDARKDFKVVDLLVLQATAVAAGAAFLIGTTLAPRLEVGIFVLYVLALGTLILLGLGLLSSLAKLGEEPTVALATSISGRRRRSIQARLRWLRVVLKRRRPTTPIGPGFMGGSGPSWA